MLPSACDRGIEPPSPRLEAGPAAAPGRLAGARAVGDPAHTSLLLGAALAHGGLPKDRGLLPPLPTPADALGGGQQPLLPARVYFPA